MRIILEFERDRKRYCVLANRFSINEDYIDGVFECVTDGNIVKIRFFSDTGIKDVGVSIVENNLSIILGMNQIRALSDLITHCINLNNSYDGQ